PRENRFAIYTGALFGLGGPKLRERDAVEDFAKLHFAGLMNRHVRNADGLAALLAGYFRVPVRIESFVGHWMKIPVQERTRLGGLNDSAMLGVGTVLGARSWDRQHKFRIWLGPLTRTQY